jgi:ribosomal protein L29
MSPEVTAAIIAGGVGIVTVIATVIVQIVGFRSTKANTGQQIKATHEQLDRTLAEQRTRTLNERFATAAEQLGNYNKAAVRLAGVYAMAGVRRRSECPS